MHVCADSISYRAHLCLQENTVDVMVSEGDKQNGPQYHRGTAPKV